MKYGVVVKVEGSRTETMVFMVGGESILEAFTRMYNSLSKRNLIPVSVAIHEFGQPIPFDKIEAYYPNTNDYEHKEILK